MSNTIHLVTFCTEAWKQLGDLVEPNKIAWCTRHGVQYVRRLHTPDWTWRERVQFWLEELPRCDWMFFQGADTIITNMTVTPESFTTGDHEAVFILDGNGMQSDSFWMKNCPASIAMVEWIRANPTGEPHEQAGFSAYCTGVPRYFDKMNAAGIFNCQGVIAEHFRDGIVAAHRHGTDGQPSPPIIKFVPHRELNAYPHEHYPWGRPDSDCSWKTGAFVLHAPGLDNNKRFQFFPQYLANVKET